MGSNSIEFTSTGEQFVYPLPPSRIKLARWDGTASPVIFDGSADRLRAFNHSLSKDGKHVALELSQAGQPTSQIAVMDSDGSHLRWLTHDDNSNGHPNLSPDGAMLVYRVTSIERGLSRVGQGMATERGLRIVSLADGKTMKLTNGW